MLNGFGLKCSTVYYKFNLPSTNVYIITWLDYVLPNTIIPPASFTAIKSAENGTLVYSTILFPLKINTLLFIKSISEF